MRKFPAPHMSTRAMLKPLVERTLVACGAPAWGRRQRAREAVVLAYHNVVPDGVATDGDPSLHLPRVSFAAQLDDLRRTHDVVPLPDLLRPAAPGAARPRAAITMDDAYRGAVTLGVRELARRGLPATIFVATSFVGGRTFWWDAVEGSARVREHALGELRGEDAAVRAWADAHAIPLQAPPSWCRAASVAELEEAARTPGITLGSHTVTHPNLTRLRPEELARELDDSLRQLRESYPSVIPWLSYPYGLSSPAVEAAARAGGYEGAVRISAGWVGAAGGMSEPLRLPRINVPAGLSIHGFSLRTSGAILR